MFYIQNYTVHQFTITVFQRKVQEIPKHERIMLFSLHFKEKLSLNFQLFQKLYSKFTQINLK